MQCKIKRIETNFSRVRKFVPENTKMEFLTILLFFKEQNTNILTIVMQYINIKKYFSPLYIKCLMKQNKCFLEFGNVTANNEIEFSKHIFF